MAHHSSLGSFMNYDLGYIDLEEKTLLYKTLLAQGCMSLERFL